MRRMSTAIGKVSDEVVAQIRIIDEYLLDFSRIDYFACARDLQFAWHFVQLQ